MKTREHGTGYRRLGWYVRKLTFRNPSCWKDSGYCRVTRPSDIVLLGQLSKSVQYVHCFVASQSSPSYGARGDTSSVSPARSSNGIVWAPDTTNYCAASCGPAVLHAYDATILRNELWNSSTVSGDAADNAVKFTIPTVRTEKFTSVPAATHRRIVWLSQRLR